MRCYEEKPFSILKGKTLKHVRGLYQGSDEVRFVTESGTEYLMYNPQSCSSVEIEDVCGDVEDLIDSEILVAEVNENKEWPAERSGSLTWTFYKLATRKGYVDVRWLGKSNGYYSESVNFEEVVDKDEDENTSEIS